MNSKKQKGIFCKEDADSGLDNTSDSGNSDDENLFAIFSDYEDLTNNDKENSFPVKEINLSETKELNNKNVGQLSNPSALQKASFTNKIFVSDLGSPSLEQNSFSEDKHDFYIELNYENLIEDDYKEAVKFFRTLAKGQYETVDFSITSFSKKPEWLNEEKFKRGQNFAKNHLFCINFAEMLSLFILFAQKSSLRPLIFTGKSDSPYTAFQRYLNTLTKLMSWYQHDIWNEKECLGKKNLSIVRNMHKNIYQKLTKCSEKDLKEKTTLGDPTTTAIWCPLRDLLKADFRDSISGPHEDVEHYLTDKRVWINQTDMSVTQLGFVGLAVTYPEYFGIYLASEEDLDAFLHLWRGLGYLLGIKDKYNYCNSDLESVRRRTKLFLEAVAKPALREITCDWEHMCRCLTAGISFYLPQVNFDSSLLYLCHILKIRTPRLRKKISFGSYLIFQLHRLIFYLMKYQWVLSWLNSKLYEIIKKAQNAPPEVLSKWERKEFLYMKQGKCPIRGQFTRQNL